MRRGPRGLLVAGLAAPAALLILLALTAPPAAANARPRHVVIAAVPGVTWEDVAAGKAPVLRSLVMSGRLGRETGEGFFSYENPADPVA